MVGAISVGWMELSGHLFPKHWSEGRFVKYNLREFRSGDEAAVNIIALDAFDEYRDRYDDWAAFSRIIGNMASLSESGELIVATIEEKIVGAVVYVGPGMKKSEFFAKEWPSCACS